MTDYTQIKLKNQNDYELINSEVEKLYKLALNLELYRRGRSLYDIGNIRPYYNLAEYAWTFCEIPYLSNDVAILFEKKMLDIRTQTFIDNIYNRRFENLIAKLDC